MSQDEDYSTTALHEEVVRLKRRLDALESRVTELEEELREAQEIAPAD